MEIESIAAYKVGAIPSVYYIPEFITSTEEEWLIQQVNSSKAKWTTLSRRRLQNYGGHVHKKGLIQAPLPSWLQSICTRLHKEVPVFGAGAPNHVLVNAYEPGEGILAHEDGPLYYPGVCILSLSSTVVIKFKAKPGELEPVTSNSGDTFSLVLQPRSLLVFADVAYTHFLHGIEETLTDQLDDNVINLKATGLEEGGTLQRDKVRLSLTVRRVLNTFKNFLKV